MDNAKLIPDFGPLCGMRVLCSGSLIAMPFAASMLAEFGAEVIQIERPGIGDRYRNYPPLVQHDGAKIGAAWLQEARNRLSLGMELDLHDDDAKELFFRLIRRSDIYMENMVWLEKLGVRDEDLFQVNPHLVILHVSGYGNARFGGSPQTCEQASYDLIGQAYSGFMQFNGTPDQPCVINPSLTDYVSAMFALFGVLSAYIHAQKSGQGQVVDISQFEAQAKLMQDAFVRESEGLSSIKREEKALHRFQPWDVFPTSDNQFVACGAVGEAVFNRFASAIGLSLDRFPYWESAVGVDVILSDQGKALRRELEAWFASHTADEIVSLLRKARVPCSKVNTIADCMQDPHFLARGDFITYHDQTLNRSVTGFGIFPKFSLTPGQVWRGAPTLGQDSITILRDLLEYTEEEINLLKKKRII